MTLLVRAAEPGDAAALTALADAVGSEPEGWVLGYSPPRTVADERRYLRALRRHPNGAVLVAEVDGRIAGRLSIARDPHPSSPHVADLGLIVAAGERRRGIGTALLAAAETWARRSGIGKLELHVLPHNAPAIALYEKLGYEREGVRRAQYRRADGSYLDAVLMAKFVQAPVDEL
jgi:RimJ/RimL family protein N-acetyltransferase